MEPARFVQAIDMGCKIQVSVMDNMKEVRFLGDFCINLLSGTAGCVQRGGGWSWGINSAMGVSRAQVDRQALEASRSDPALSWLRRFLALTDFISQRVSVSSAVK